MNPQSTAILGPIQTKTHGHLWPISHNPGTVFNSPETQQWAVHGHPTCPTSISPFGTEFLTYFLSYKHPSIIYSNLTAQPVSRLSRTVQKPPKFLQFPSHVLGLIKRPIPDIFFTSIHDLNHYFHLNSPLIFWAVTANQRIPKKFQQFGPMFWDRTTAHFRHFLISSMHFNAKILELKTQTAPKFLGSHG